MNEEFTRITKGEGRKGVNPRVTPEKKRENQRIIKRQSALNSHSTGHSALGDSLIAVVFGPANRALTLISIYHPLIHLSLLLYLYSHFTLAGQVGLDLHGAGAGARTSDGEGSKGRR